MPICKAGYLRYLCCAILCLLFFFSAQARSDAPFDASDSSAVAGPDVAIDRPQSRLQRIISRLPHMALTNNLLYDAAGAPNLGIKVHIRGRWSAAFDWHHAWWGNRRSHHSWRFYGGNLDVNYRLSPQARPDNPFTGHHVGAYVSLLYYDMQLGPSHVGEMSARFNYAAGLSYTYSMPIARHFNIEFSIGAGYIWGPYKKFRPIDDHDVWMSTRRRNWFGPTRAGITLVWLIGDKTSNERKGGAPSGI